MSLSLNPWGLNCAMCNNQLSHCIKLKKKKKKKKKKKIVIIIIIIIITKIINTYLPSLPRKKKIWLTEIEHYLFFIESIIRPQNLSSLASGTENFGGGKKESPSPLDNNPCWIAPFFFCTQTFETLKKLSFF
jgi:hypothetical protein